MLLLRAHAAARCHLATPPGSQRHAASGCDDVCGAALCLPAPVSSAKGVALRPRPRRPALRRARLECGGSGGDRALPPPCLVWTLLCVCPAAVNREGAHAGMCVWPLKQKRSVCCRPARVAAVHLHYTSRGPWRNSLAAAARCMASACRIAPARIHAKARHAARESRAPSLAQHSTPPHALTHAPHLATPQHAQQRPQWPLRA